MEESGVLEALLNRILMSAGPFLSAFPWSRPFSPLLGAKSKRPNMQYSIMTLTNEGPTSKTFRVMYVRAANRRSKKVIPNHAGNEHCKLVCPYQSVHTKVREIRYSRSFIHDSQQAWKLPRHFTVRPVPENPRHE